MALVDEAAALAREAHAGQGRKPDGKIPYFTHLESVVERLRAFGYSDETTLAAAYLHDLLEDQPRFAERLAALPRAVVETVEALTEPKLDERGAKLPKELRFTAYRDKLSSSSEAARRARPISCANKLDNLTSLLEAERAGKQLMVQLSTRPGQQARHLAELRAIYAGSVRQEMLTAFDERVRELHSYVERWLPGRALAVAASAHLGQFDRAGEPYALHPLRLALRGRSPEERMAAALHDVVEDTSWTLEKLAEEGFPPSVIDAIDRLTRRAGESYEEFIERAAGSALSARVKLYDLEDNLNLARLPSVSADDLARIERYHRARRRILAALGEASG
jgi:(p)ppGpp synthase/HD superfamily hydrolase